ncbi:WD40 repeat-like protein [Imleria badia]|nr:WD40 repeat-like protein [Imleria badia]
MSGGKQGRIRRWQVEDGKEVGTPMDAGRTVGALAVSRDGKWVVSGTGFIRITVWNAESHSKAKEFTGHSSYVRAVDVSQDGTRTVTGSEDGTVCIWSLPDSQRLLGPLQLPNHVVAVKFSPDGHLIATATWKRFSVQIYDSQTGHRLVDVPIHVSSQFNQSLAWARDGKQLFVLSVDGDIYCLDTSNGATLSKWRIHNSSNARCIALASNGKFIAASAGSSVSFWDTTTRKQIGSTIRHQADVVSMAISKNYDIVIGGDEKITLRNLQDVVPSSYYEDMFREQEIERLRIERAKLEESLGAHDRSSNSKIADLEKTIQQLRDTLADSQRIASQKANTLNETIKSLGAKDKSSSNKIAHLKKTVEELRTRLTRSQRKADENDNLIKTLHVGLRAHEQQHHCEALFAEGRIHDAAKSLIGLANTGDGATPNVRIFAWVSDFAHRCKASLERIGDEASSVEKYDQALEAYSLALSLGPSSPNTVLIKWVNAMLTRGSANEALAAAAKFELPKFLIYQAICDVLERDRYVSVAIEYFKQMQSELTEDTSTHPERAAWELDFRARCVGRLEELGDATKPEEAIGHYSKALSLGPMNPIEILAKRSKARAITGAWEEALIDADKIIELDSSCHRGYEMRHTALHRAGRHAEAVEAFNTMLLKLEQSPNEHIREFRRQYVDARPTIRRVIDETIRNMPRVLIDTATGHLYDKKRQAEAFEALPIYNELVSSMTTELDRARIWREVKEFYRYVMLSHRWEYDEPLLQKVEKISIYELKASPANIKLQRFCSLARSRGFHWAWSDTCCVDKVNNVVLQESLVAMFTWYRGSSLTVVYLRGVSSLSQLPDGLRRSVWNTRAWTYQEYVAAETVQFYTEDWKPYLGLTLSNHKDSPDIISEMQQATGVSAQELAVLGPGLDRVREKLYFASKRQTTLVEDVAYSLLGIFNVAIPVIYGEGNRAVGRLLEHILTGSGDVTILAWTGRAGSYNSCLPVDLAVYDQLVPPHFPQPVEAAEMDRMVLELRSASPDLSLVGMLYDRLHALPPSPSLAAKRLRLPAIVFPITEFVRTSDSDPVTSLHVYRATTSALGNVEIKTADDLTGMNDLRFVHPWIRTLLDQEFEDGAAGLNKTMKALRLVARLRQPFGALLFAPLSRVEYRRVAADSLIMVRVCGETSLTDLVDDVRMIDVH